MIEAGAKPNCILKPLEALEGFNRALEALRGGKICAVSGPDDSQRAHLLAGLCRASGKRLIVLEPNEVLAMRMTEDLNTLVPGAAKFLPARDVSFVKSTAASRDLAMRRVEVMGACVTGDVSMLVLSAEAAVHRMPPAERFAGHVIEIDAAMHTEPSALIEKIVAAGYERVHLVEARGQCALRGGILDVYPVGAPNALRIEFFDDEVDSIRTFDVLTQRSISKRERVRIYPAKEFLLSREEAARAAQRIRFELEHRERFSDADARQKQIEDEFGLDPFEKFLKEAEEAEPETERVSLGSRRDRGFLNIADALETGRGFDNEDSLLPALTGAGATVLDYLPDAAVVFDQPERLRERCEDRMQVFGEAVSTALERGDAIAPQANLLLSWDEFLARADGRAVITANPFLRQDKDFAPQVLAQIECRNATGYQANIRELCLDLKKWKEDGWRVALLAGGSARGERLEQAVRSFECEASYCETPPESVEPGNPVILPMTVSRGFLYPEIRYAVIAEGDLYGVSRQKGKAKARSGEKIAAFTDLKVGDYVVHENHGVGQFMGVVRLSSDGTFRDFLHIRYQSADKLYVPTDQLDRVQKYIGSEGEAPKLNRLSGGEWQRQKAKVRASIRDIAGDLLKLYAERESVPGFAFDPDTPWQREFEDNFPYEETPDQLAAIADIKRDMEKPQIMDRLLCGDVGYGKTEVALRAVFKCVMSGKQAAMLAPTTILVQQHYATMLNRFAGFPVHVEALSRFKSAAEQKEILKRLRSGEVDVVVGTHRLLAKDVEFKDLGLLVVDEEQRFGVTHKEAIKKLKKSVDVLTLTATPIPRTLHMSMVGIRDMSLLQSPPEERFPVQTYVVEYSDGLVRDAILRELSRGGQVYVLYNRVQTIEIMFQRLKRLVPEARIAVGHGQMRESALEDVMLDFNDGKFDVLLCTTIIEAGLDVQRANTLIVCNADQFGLSQLYQLRGRVGRSNRLAYAYLTVSPNKVITETADKRLNAIKEFTEFGAGFRVAMRDLEIRGAGNLLGSEQSGFIASVGYDLYAKMIEEAIHEMKGDTRDLDFETRVDVKVDAYLSKEYVPDDLTRLEMYKKIASIDSDDAREDMTDELIDRFGDLNRPAENLIEIATLKSLCRHMGIDYVCMRGGELWMRFSISADINLIPVLMAIKNYPNSLRINGKNPPTLIYFDPKHKNEALRTSEGENSAILMETLLRGAVKVMKKVVAEYEAAMEAEE